MKNKIPLAYIFFFFFLVAIDCTQEASSVSTVSWNGSEGSERRFNVSKMQGKRHRDFHSTTGTGFRHADAESVSSFVARAHLSSRFPLAHFSMLSLQLHSLWRQGSHRQECLSHLSRLEGLCWRGHDDGYHRTGHGRRT
jgi:hypothetical protein